MWPQPAAEPEADGFLSPPTRPGDLGRLGEYHVIAKIGAGGMGVVYRAEDARLRRPTALKVMAPALAARPDYRERFLREARAAATVEHENVVPVYHVGEENGVPFLAMPLLAGRTLQERLGGKPAAVAEVLVVARQLAAGLAAAHARGLIHRDVKPSNVWVEEAADGSVVRVRLLDFGLAIGAGDARLTGSNQLFGTPAYMSPEQARGGPLDARTDLFSLGCVLYEMATGRRPFGAAAGDAYSVLSALASETPPPPRTVNSALPPALSALIVRLLEKDAADRPQTAQIVAASLTRIALEPAAERRRPRRAALVAAGLFATLVVIAGVIVIRIKDKDGKETTVEVPPGGKATITPGPGATVVVENPKDAEPKSTGITDPDRRAAAYVRSIGGKMCLNGSNSVYDARDLPKQEFTLTEVDLSGSKLLTDAGLANFKDCKNLHAINLQQTKIGDAGLANFGACKRLKFLDLSETNVTDVGLALFKNCGRLTHLSLSRTDVGDPGLEQFRGRTDMIRLELVNTLVTDVGLSYFKSCDELEILELDSTKVTNAGLGYFANCKQLTRLSLSCTNVSDDGLANFKHSTNLLRLFLGGTQVSDAGLVYFLGCRNLQNLYVENTRVSDVGLSRLKEFQLLSVLGVHRCKNITDTSIPHLKGFKNLTFVNVTESGISKSGFDDLVKSLPKCKIERN